MLRGRPVRGVTWVKSATHTSFFRCSCLLEGKVLVCPSNAGKQEGTEQTRSFGTATISTRHDRTLHVWIVKVGRRGLVRTCQWRWGEWRLTESTRRTPRFDLSRDDERSEHWACARLVFFLSYATDDSPITNNCKQGRASAIKVRQGFMGLTKIIFGSCLLAGESLERL